MFHRTKPVEILSVEDNPSDQRLIQELLKGTKTPYHLSFVSDGTNAMRYLRKEGDYSTASRPDIILLDLNLPGKSGQEVLAEIKQSSEFCNIPVIILTTSSAEQDILTCYELRANCYITKPKDLEWFGNILKAIEVFWMNCVQLPPYTP